MVTRVDATGLAKAGVGGRSATDLTQKVRSRVANTPLGSANSAEPTIDLVEIFCPKCGHKFTHQKMVGRKATGGLGGAVAGAALGAKIGIVAGPLGAFAGTIPGAFFGAMFGSSAGSKLGRPKCKKCGTSFQAP
jgi:hypothetical protein